MRRMLDAIQEARDFTLRGSDIGLLIQSHHLPSHLEHSIKNATAHHLNDVIHKLLGWF